MRALSLDYRSTTQAQRRFGLLLLTLGLLLTADAVFTFEKVSAELQRWQDKLANVQSRQNAPAPRSKPAADSRAQAQEIQRANAILRDLSLPWHVLFEAIESVGDGRVALLEIEPDAKARQVKIAGEAKNLDDVLRYVEGLNATAVLSEAYLLSHQIRSEEPGKPVTFSLVARWTVAP